MDCYRYLLSTCAEQVGRRWGHSNEENICLRPIRAETGGGNEELVVPVLWSGNEDAVFPGAMETPAGAMVMVEMRLTLVTDQVLGVNEKGGGSGGHRV
jgi:hypothetical protein